MVIGARSTGAGRVARIGALGLILLVAVVVPSRATGSSPLAFSFFTDPGISVPVQIISGPDGAIWFTNFGNATIGRMTTAGTVTAYADPGSSPQGITVGPDGAVWFTNYGDGTIGRVNADGTVTTYTDHNANLVSPGAIVVGPDGALWFTTGSDSIGRITTTGVFSYYVDPRIVRPIDIATGSDGALWFTSLSNTIGRIDTAGVVTIFTDPDISWAYRIAAGPDGVLWFTNLGNGRIGRITTNGQVSTYGDSRIVAPYGITAGPDDSVWFTDTGSNAIGRISSTGEISIYTDPGISGPFDITAGTDGAVWFNNVNNSTIGRLAVSVDTTPPTATASATSNGEPYSAGTWTRHDVVVHFTCTDADSGVASVTPDQTVSSEGTGQSVAGTCTDNAGNGTSTTFVNIEIDKTAPAVTYLGAAPLYTVDQQIAIHCQASDESSGVASNSCADVVGPAYLYTLGANTIMATATDQAGNSGMGSVSFTVAVTPASIGNLGLQFVRSSTAYQRLPAKQQALIDKLAGMAATAVERILPNLNAAQKTALFHAYDVAVAQLVRGGWLTHAQADTLARLAAAL